MRSRRLFLCCRFRSVHHHERRKRGGIVLTQERNCYTHRRLNVPNGLDEEGRDYKYKGEMKRWKPKLNDQKGKIEVISASSTTTISILQLHKQGKVIKVLAWQPSDFQGRSANPHQTKAGHNLPSIQTT